VNNNQDDSKPQAKPTSHWVLWTLVVVFVVGSIAVMVMADYFFAPGASGNVAIPKDAADK